VKANEDLYSLPVEALAKQFNTSIDRGLCKEVVESAKLKYGSNSLKDSASKGILKTLGGQFTDMLVVIFILTGLLDYYLKQYRDGTILIAIVVVNALIGFYQEMKSENILASLKKLVVEKCKVLRNGKILEIVADDLVPGDIVKLYEGDGVPVDIRLVQSNEFSTNEFILTGESLPANKDSTLTIENKVPLSDIRNSVFMGTTVARGEATGVVYATGMQTMLGEMFPLTALTFDPPEDDIIDAPPRNPADKILTKPVLWGILFRGSVIGLAAYASFLAEYFHNHHLSDHYEKSTTVMYASILFGQFANVLSTRTKGPALGKYLFSNRKLWGALGLSVAFMLLIVYVPFLNYYFHTSPLYLIDWLFPIGSGAICLTVYELMKKMKRTDSNHLLQTT
jgi:magnesium-transporting ATPase (P-type)